MWKLAALSGTWLLAVFLIGIGALPGAAGASSEPAAQETVTAPEFPSATRWLQSKPLTLASLRGKVVVVHFYTFGCINCAHNYPAYKAWQQKYTDKDVVILGIHTPETWYEKYPSKILVSARKNGLKFPIAVDNDRKIWELWKCQSWPSIYLVDKKGRIRATWQGELNWQNAQGERLMQDKIETLQKEE